MKKISIILLIQLILPVLSIAQKNVLVSGNIIDGSNGERIPYASINSLDYKIVEHSDETGSFQISLIQGSILLIFNSVGFKSEYIRLNVNNDTTIIVSMDQVNTLNEARIYAQRINNVQNSRMSFIELPINLLKKAPTLLGEVDIFKYIQLMPGVQSSGDGKAGFYVRGGNNDQNMIIFDGATLYNPEHMKGFVSIFDSEIVDRVLVYRGGFPAKYGSRLSSVVDISIRDGDYKKYHGSASIGLLSGKLNFEGPVISNRTSFILAARRSHYNFIANNFLRAVYDVPEALNQFSNLSFYDLNAKMSHMISDSNKLSLSFYQGVDNSDYDGKVNQSEETNNQRTIKYKSKYDSKNKWGNSMIGFNWHHKISGGKTLNTKFFYTTYKYLYNVESFSEHTVSIPNSLEIINSNTNRSVVSYDSKIKEISVGPEIIIKSGKHSYNAGILLSFQQFDPFINTYRYTSITTSGINAETLSENRNGFKSAIYTSALYAEKDTDFNSLSINTGARINLYSLNGKNKLFIEPRVGLRFLILTNFSLKASYTKMSQPIHLLSSSNLVLPSDIWVPATKSIQPMTSNLFSVGLFYDLLNSVNFSLEAYYKDFNNALEYKDGASFINNPDSWEDMVYSGKGLSYGLELLAQKNIGKLTGSLSYTWSKSLRLFDRDNNIVNEGKSFYAKNDCRNNFAFNISHVISKRVDISATFAYKTGSRGTLSETILLGRTIFVSNTLTPESGYLSGNHPSPIINPSGSVTLTSYEKIKSYTVKNGYKLPDYHRLDIGINYHIYHQIGTSTLSLSIYNLYNHFNIHSVYPDYENNKNVLKGICLFPFMPSLSYSYKF